MKGFELDKKSGPSGRGLLTLKKVAGETTYVPIRLHCDLPSGDIKQLTIKQEASGAWYASFTIDAETPEKPDPESIGVDDCVGIDLGIMSFIHDSDNRSISRLDLSDERKRLEREQRSLSRKEFESRNWHAQRKQVAQVHERMNGQKADFRHKAAHFYTTVYDLVVLEDLDVKGMLESVGNARNKAEVGWGDTIDIFEHHGEKNACHVITVDPRGTTKECSKCGVETPKPIWVRTHDCPACGFEADRDLNAALNVLSRGLEQLGVVHSEETPVETATAVSTDGGDILASDQIDASRVVEAGSRALKDTGSPAE